MAKISNNETAKDRLRTVFVMQMGQFIDHDFAHSPNFQEPANCCNEKKEIDIELEEHKKKCIDKAYSNNLVQEEDCEKMWKNVKERLRDYKEHCFPIPIPEDDPYFQSIGRTCMDFHRAISSPNLNCELGKREQVNQIIKKPIPDSRVNPLCA